MKNLIFTILTLSLTAFAAEVRHHGAHEHGVSKLDIAVTDAKSATLEMDSPGMDVFGFEHEAKTEAEKKKVADVKALFTQRPATFFIPPAGCTLTSTKFEMEKDDDHEKAEAKGAKGAHAAKREAEHSDLNANWELKCPKALAGNKLEVNLPSELSSMRKIKVEVVTPKAQKEVIIQSGKGSISF